MPRVESKGFPVRFFRIALPCRAAFSRVVLVASLALGIAGVLTDAAHATDIYRINANGSGRTPLTANNGVDDAAPAYSPNGTKIAFESTVFSEALGTDYGVIFTMNADGSGRTQLTSVDETEGSNDRAPAYKPNGTKILFSRSTLGLHTSIPMEPG